MHPLAEPSLNNVNRSIARTHWIKRCLNCTKKNCCVNICPKRRNDTVIHANCLKKEADGTKYSPVSNPGGRGGCGGYGGCGSGHGGRGFGGCLHYDWSAQKTPEERQTLQRFMNSELFEYDPVGGFLDEITSEQKGWSSKADAPDSSLQASVSTATAQVQVQPSVQPSQILVQALSNSAPATALVAIVPSTIDCCPSSFCLGSINSLWSQMGRTVQFRAPTSKFPEFHSIWTRFTSMVWFQLTGGGHQ